MPTGLFILYIALSGGQQIEILGFRAEDDCRRAAEVFNAALPAVREAVSKADGVRDGFRLNDVTHYACSTPTS